MEAVELLFAYAIFALLATAVAVLTGGYVVAVRPRDRVNRTLGGFFIIGGVIMGASRVLWIVPWEELAHALAVLDTALNPAVAGAYLLLIGAVIRSPLAAPFRHPTARLVTLVVASAMTLVLLALPSLSVVDFRASEEWRWDWTGTALSGAMFYVGPLAALYALAASIDAHRRAPRGSAERQRAFLYLCSFGLLDGFGAGVLLLQAVLPSGAARLAVGYLGLPIVLLLVYPAVGYAVLRKQVIDIDLRLKVATRRSLMVAAFATAFWLGEQTLSEIFPMNGPVWGFAFAAALTLAFRPLDRLAERIADRVFPGVSASSRYLDERRAEVYLAAVQGATDDAGKIDARGRAILEKLRAKLDLTPEQAGAIEARAS